ncbi:unnamed protein product [Caenorhabditis brenneri]
MDYYSTRAVNKTFNCAVLGILRKDNRIMKLELKHYAQTNPVKDVYVVLINLTPLFLPYCAYYFKFLNKIVGVQVEQLEVIDLWKLTLKPSDAHLFKKFHEDIHSELIGNNHVKSLIGLEDVSNNCLECVEIARKCLEYGPIDEFWMQIDFGKHFGKIVLTDVFLDKIASSCVSDSESKEDCYKMLEDRFSKPNISCTTLTLCIHENRDTDNTMIHQNHTPIPWEALEMALKKWKVQSIEIKFTLIPRLPMRQPADFFKFPQKCSHVQVDLSRSFDCGKELKLQYLRRGYENVVANIRRIFQPDQISIDFTHWLFIEPSNPQELLENFLRISRLAYCQYLTINFKVYLEILDAIQLSEFFKATESLRPVYHNALNKKHIFETVKWVGERFRFVDHREKFTMNADLFVTEENYKKVTLKERQATEFMDMFQLDLFE